MRANLLHAGQLRHPIVIQTPTVSQDTYGAVTKTWAAYASVRAQIEPLVGKEYFAAEQTVAKATHRVRIRYCSGVTTAMRVSFGSRYFNIQAVVDVEERNREMVLMVRETTA